MIPFGIATTRPVMEFFFRYTPLYRITAGAVLWVRLLVRFLNQRAGRGVVASETTRGAWAREEL